jgi:hypothetical protein
MELAPGLRDLLDELVEKPEHLVQFSNLVRVCVHILMKTFN